MNKITLALALFFVSINAGAAIRLPHVLSSNMVVQQQSKVKLWGWASPGEKILITTSWNNRTDTVKATSEASFAAFVHTPAAGGPYSITFKGSNTIVLENILVGEVWLCSGQSNMEWSAALGIQQMKDELPNSANSNIRLFNMPKATSATPQDDAPGSWQVCGPAAAKDFSAVAYFFGKQLQEKLKVPIGLINASWGGTAAEVWTPAAIVNNDVELKKAAAALEPTPWWTTTAGNAYNAMIYPLTAFSISGAIWYQGESNVVATATYQKLFTEMIGAWRKNWQKTFPFYYVQIAPYNYKYPYTGALLREQQVKSLSVPNTGMVVITDLVDDIKNIHPKNKKDVGKRLANFALGATYHQPLGVYESPLFKNVEIKKDKAILYFENAPNGFRTNDGKKPSEFFIAGADKNFFPADVQLGKDKIIVSSKQVREPVAVRFGFSNTAMPNLMSKEGLPVCPFRTDNWEVRTGVEKK